MPTVLVYHTLTGKEDNNMSVHKLSYLQHRNALQAILCPNLNFGSGVILDKGMPQLTSG